MTAVGRLVRQLGVAMAVAGAGALLVWTAVDDVPVWLARVAAVALVVLIVVWDLAVVRPADRRGR